MTKHLLHQRIDALKSHVLREGGMVEEAIALAIRALIERNAELAEEVIDNDVYIDQMEVDIEEDCLELLALYQPVAADLRFIVAVLKINNDLERMGDLAKNIAKRAKYLAKHGEIELPVEIHDMADKAQRMVKACLDALVQSDPAAAKRIRMEDDLVDEARKCVRGQITRRIEESPEHTESLLKLNSVSKHLERLADMATNVAEDVIYMVEGQIVRHRRVG